MEYISVDNSSLIYKLVNSLKNTILVALVPSILLMLLFSKTDIMWQVFGMVILVAAGTFFIIGGFIDFLAYKSLGYKFDDSSLHLKEGSFSVSSVTIPFVKIINVSYHQSLLQRIFKVGTVVIDQEDSTSIWKDIDKATAHKVITQVSSKSHIQSVHVK